MFELEKIILIFATEAHIIQKKFSNERRGNFHNIWSEAILA